MRLLPCLLPIVIKSTCFVELPYLAKYILVACLTYSATQSNNHWKYSKKKKVKLQSTDQMYLWIIFPCHRNRYTKNEAKRTKSMNKGNMRWIWYLRRDDAFTSSFWAELSPLDFVLHVFLHKGWLDLNLEGLWSLYQTHTFFSVLTDREINMLDDFSGTMITHCLN